MTDEEKPMISISHWGMFLLPRRRYTDERIPQTLIRHQKPPELDFRA